MFWSMFPVTRVPFWYRFFEPYPSLLTLFAERTLLTDSLAAMTRRDSLRSLAPLAGWAAVDLEVPELRAMGGPIGTLQHKVGGICLSCQTWLCEKHQLFKGKATCLVFC